MGRARLPSFFARACLSTKPPQRAESPFSPLSSSTRGSPAVRSFGGALVPYGGAVPGGRRSDRRPLIKMWRGMNNVMVESSRPSPTNRLPSKV